MLHEGRAPAVSVDECRSWAGRRAWLDKDCGHSSACTRSSQSTGGPRAGDTGGGSSGSPTCVRIFRIVSGWVMKLIRRMSPPQFGHASGNASPTRANSFAQAIREVSCVNTPFHRCCWFCQRLLPDCRDCQSPWRSRPNAAGGSVQTPRDSAADAFGAVESALPADPKTQTGSGRQHHSSQAALTSVHGPAPPSRPAYAGAGHSEPGQAGRPGVPRPTAAPAQTLASRNTAADVPNSGNTLAHRGQRARCAHLHRLKTRCAARRACQRPPQQRS